MGRIILITGIAAVMLTLNSCKKETPVVGGGEGGIITNTPAITETGDVHKRGTKTSYISGLLDSDSVALKGPVDYYADGYDQPTEEELATTTNGTNGNGGNGNPNAGSGNNNGNGGNGGNGNNKVTVIDTLIVGSHFTTATKGGINALVVGTVEIRKLSVRIYVAPISTGPDNPRQEYFSMLAPASIPFASSANPNEGAFVMIRDNAGVEWTSVGDQTGSTFEITDRGSNSGQYTSFAGVMSLKMYDSFGNSKVFTGVNFSVLAGLE